MNVTLKLQYTCFIAIGLIALCICSSPAFCAKPYAATVLRVVDGDTLEVQRGQEIEHVRLFGIDAPEKNQDFGPEMQVRLISETISQTLNF